MGLRNDNRAVAPIVWGIVIIVGLVAGIGVYQTTQRPDITYNISDTGFSLAGVDVSWFAVIAFAGFIAFIVFMVFRRKPQPQTRYISPWERR